MKPRKPQWTVRVERSYSGLSDIVTIEMQFRLMTKVDDPTPEDVIQALGATFARYISDAHRFAPDANGSVPQAPQAEEVAA